VECLIVFIVSELTSQSEQARGRNPRIIQQLQEQQQQ